MVAAEKDAWDARAEVTTLRLQLKSSERARVAAEKRERELAEEAEETKRQAHQLMGEAADARHDAADAATAARASARELVASKD